jgi:glycine hydroxymethyltransferase
VRWGVTVKDAPTLAKLIARALTSPDPASLAPEVSRLRARFDKLSYICGSSA